MRRDHTLEEIHIPVGDVALIGDLGTPLDPAGIVVFAHGSGSSRLSVRNRAVAATLREAGLSTLLFDLLTSAEAEDRANVFDIELLSRRLIGATSWLHDGGRPADTPIGYFGASTGAAAALGAAAELGGTIAAVVSRGGRPDLAEPKLGAVLAPTLLIVGGDDTFVLELNRAALRHLGCVSDLAIVPGATHLFEEPGALDEVARLTSDWFSRQFAAWRPPAGSRR